MDDDDTQQTMRIGSLFSGYGGLDMAAQQTFGGEMMWHAEIDKGASKILAHRFPGVPNLGDVAAVDWSDVEPVDVLCGGFPCQDVSHAGLRAGIQKHTRSGLWYEFARAIDQLRPKIVVIENVRGLLSADAACDVEPCPWCVGDGPAGHMRALGAVLADLAEIGFDAEWGVLSAAAVGAPHRRERVFIVAEDAGNRAHRRGRGAAGAVAVRPVGSGSRAAANADRGQRGQRGGQNIRGDAVPADSTHPRDEDRAVTPLLPTPQSRDHKDQVVEQSDSHRPGDTDSVPRAVKHLQTHDFGPYQAAVDRWAAILDRPAPPPTTPGPDGRPRLNPRLVEWMMGLPSGWVCDAPGITRTQALKALGNGVVPQQAAAALRRLAGRLNG